jgi:hypothetical protein
MMCGRHWARVPRVIQREVWAAYRPGQEVDKNPSEAYMKAYKRAVNAVDEAEGAVLTFPPLKRQLLPLDYTFCSGLRCDRTADCLRFIRRPGHAERFGTYEKQIAVAQFADADGVCEKFIDGLDAT